MANTGERGILVADSQLHGYTPLVDGRTVEVFPSLNNQYREVVYLSHEPLVLGKVFQLDREAHQFPFSKNPFARMAITIAESELVLDLEKAGDLARRLTLDNTPRHLLNIRNWNYWANIIGTGQAVPFAFSLEDEWEGVKVFEVKGISFSNAIFAGMMLTDELIQQSGLHFTRANYMKLLEPFGLLGDSES
jgi:hypothetical protein